MTSISTSRNKLRSYPSGYGRRVDVGSKVYWVLYDNQGFAVLNAGTVVEVVDRDGCVVVDYGLDRTRIATPLLYPSLDLLKSHILIHLAVKVKGPKARDHFMERLAKDIQALRLGEEGAHATAPDDALEIPE